MKLAFHFAGGLDWQAGKSFVEDSLYALRSLGPDAPELILITDGHVNKKEYEALLSVVDSTAVVQPIPAPPLVPEPLSWRRRVKQWLRRNLNRVASNTSVSDTNSQKFDCTFYVGSGMSLPVSGTRVAWIFDFQHVHLPKIFSPQDKASRNYGFRLHSQLSNLVLVTTNAVRNDFEAFAPDLAGRVRVVHLVPNIPDAVYQISPQDLLAQYHLPEKFILVPNQFWKHKNHRLILEALAILKERQIEPVIVCTGNLVDPRDPRYFGELLQQASLAGVREQFIVLGILPRREDVLALMRQSIGVLNPSLFEGFGYTAAESMALGKPALLSDLPAHHEHQHPRGIYFDPLNIQDLTEKLEAIWCTEQPGPVAQDEEKARNRIKIRQQEFGRALVQVAREAMALNQTAS